MADARRWNAGSGVRREDEFTRAPSFRDGHDSAPLETARASWHGGGHHHVSLGVGLAILAAVAAVAFMMLAPGHDGADAPASGAAAEGGDVLPTDPGPGAVPGNATSLTSAAPTLPTVPALP